MGIVRKQSIKSTIITYAGFVIGALNYYLLARFFTKQEVGLTRILFNVCSILAGLCALGSIPMFTRFFPYYRDKAKKGMHELLFWTVVINFFGFLLMVFFSLIFRHLIIRKFIGNSALFIQYFYLIYPFTFFLVAYNVYENYANNLHRTALTSFLRETVMRITVLACIALYLFRLIGFGLFIHLFSLVYGVIFLVLLFYLFSIRHFGLEYQASPVTRSLYKRMALYGTFMFGGSVFMLVSQNIDGIMIGSLKGLQYTAVFELANYISMVIMVPQRSISAIASPLIAASWKENDLAAIANLYRKSAMTQLILGIGILGVIWINADNIFHFLPAYKDGKYIILVLGLARVIDLGTGLNYQILLNSRMWKLDFITSVILVIAFIFLNYVLIRKYGMIGSAWSTLMAMTVYNGLRYIFIKWKFGLQPFTSKTLLALISGLVSWQLSSRIPWAGNIYLDIFVRTVLFVLIFGTCTLGLHLSQDMDQTWHKLLVRIKVKSR
ncbi:MAG TPA: oligosaccharide flippase family protein [Chitinophagaceae bacterium]|nr:oligosaccharide flippase family protein [Chitinophagaceae bacterium]